MKNTESEMFSHQWNEEEWKRQNPYIRTDGITMASFQPESVTTSYGSNFTIESGVVPYDPIGMLTVVDKGEDSVGIAKAGCPSGATIIVANYSPLGNYMGQKPY